MWTGRVVQAPDQRAS